jgi:hypothetical protein
MENHLQMLLLPDRWNEMGEHGERSEQDGTTQEYHG